MMHFLVNSICFIQLQNIHQMRKSPAKTYVDYISGPIKIKDGLYMGDEIAAKDMDFIASNKVTHIINTVVNKIPNIYERLGIQYLSVNWTERQQNIFDKKNNAVNMIFQFVQQAMEQGQSVLVHSINCKSRAGCVVIAYLMRKYSWSVQKCMEFIKSKKAQFKVKNSFLTQLQDLQKRMSQSNTFNSTWEQSRSNEQLIIVNTFKNSKISSGNSMVGTKGSRKKVSWGEKTIINSNTKKGQILTSTTKYRQYLEQQGIKPIQIKSILKNDQQHQKQRQQYKELQSQFQQSLNINEGRPKGRKNDELSETQKLAKSQVIGNIKGNIVNVFVNNFISNDKSSARYSSIPPKQKEGSAKKLESRSGSRIAPYQNIISSMKSPYDTNFINRVGEVTKGKKKEERNYIKASNNAQDRPHSVNLQQSMRPNQNRLIVGTKQLMNKQQLIMNSSAPKNRYVWTTQRQNISKYK